MKGYKIFYDGEKFVMEEEKSEVGNTTDFVHWMISYETAKKSVESCNNRLKKDISELVGEYDFIIIACKACDDNFLITKQEADWYLERKLSIPCRCPACRKARRAVKNAQQPKGWAAVYTDWDDGKLKVARRFKTDDEKNEFIESLHKPGCGFLEEEIESMYFVNDYNYILPI